MALALYRTYRPGSLAEVIGQEHVTGPLARALAAGRIHHAYLFSGPRGCGKTSTARILARSLNCEQGPTATPCGTCRSCQELAPNGPGSIDVVELDAATHRGVDDARELREKAIYAPAVSRYKVYILDEAHQLTSDAANALLKVVEEPPPHLRFIFATTEPDKIIPTIRSRTFHYGFRLVPARTLAEHLGGVCTAEGVPAEAAALAVVARAGAGSVRDSLSVLGQLLAGAGPDGLTYVDAVSALGLTDARLIDAFVDALSSGSAAAMFTVVDQVISAGHDPRRFLTDVLDRLRDLIILRADPGAATSGLLDVPDDATEHLIGQSQALGPVELSRAADLVSGGLSEVKGATAPRLQLELLCARLALPSRGEDLVALAARLDRLERGGDLASSRSTDASQPRPSRVQAAQPVENPRGSTPVPGTAPAAGPARASSQPHRPAGSTTPPAGPPPRPDAALRPAGSVARPDARPERSGDGQGTAAARGDAGAGQPVDHPAERVVEPRGAALPAQSSETPAGTTPAEPVAAGPRQAVPVRAPSGQVPSGKASPGQATPGRFPSKQASPGQVDAPTGQLEALRTAWPAALEQLKTHSRVAWTVFHGSAPISLGAGVLAVAVAEPGKVRAIAQNGHDERLRNVLIDLLGMDFTIDVVLDPEASSAGTDSTGSAAQALTRPTPVDVAVAGGAAATTAAPVSGGRGPVEPSAPSSGAQEAPRSPQPARGRDLMRAAAASAGEEAAADEPSADDPDFDASGQDGLALITRELGARPIGEIDHS